MRRVILFLALLNSDVVRAEANLHKQIDECDLTRDAKCLGDILHQLTRGITAQTAKGRIVTYWCICKDSSIYLARVLPDGTKAWDKLGVLGSDVQCTAQLLPGVRKECHPQ